MGIVRLCGHTGDEGRAVDRSTAAGDGNGGGGRVDGHACPGDASEKEEAEDCLSAGYVRAGCEAGAAQFAFACLFDSFLRSNALLPELSIDRNRNLRGDFLSLVATTGSPVPPTPKQWRQKTSPLGPCESSSTTFCVQHSGRSSARIESTDFGRPGFFKNTTAVKPAVSSWRGEVAAARTRARLISNIWPGI